MTVSSFDSSWMDSQHESQEKFSELLQEFDEFVRWWKVRRACFHVQKFSGTFPNNPGQFPRKTQVKQRSASGRKDGYFPGTSFIFKSRNFSTQSGKQMTLFYQQKGCKLNKRSCKQHEDLRTMEINLIILWMGGTLSYRLLNFPRIVLYFRRYFRFTCIKAVSTPVGVCD